MWYPYQTISGNSEVPPAPILQATLINPKRNDDRIYKIDAFLDTGSDLTLIPLEAVSALRLPLLNPRLSMLGVGGAATTGFPCQVEMHIGAIQLPLLEVVSCAAIAIGLPGQMIIGRDILNQLYVSLDGKRQQFSFEEG
jgi:hypothetical protein